MSASVVLAEEATQQASRIDSWWRVHRQAAPDLFTSELAAALTLLADAPESGRRYRHARIAGIRRLHLRRTRFHVYYRYDEDAELVLVFTIWSALRGRMPPL